MTWTDAIEALKELLGSHRSARVVASANLSNEALYMVHRVFADRMALKVVVPIERGQERRIKNGHREWLRSADAHPNSTGARLFGLATVESDGLKSFLSEGDGPVLVLDNRAHPWLASEEAADTLRGRPVAVLARSSTPLSDAARLLIPQASWIETEGSYTSSNGQVQLARRGFFPKAQARPAWQILFQLAVALGIEEQRTVSPRALFEQLAAEIKAFSDMSHRRLTDEPGVPVLEEVPDVG